MTEVTSTECNEIINNINKMADTSIEAIKIAQDRAIAAEQTLNKIKQTISYEINNAYKLGFNEGIKYKNTSEDDSGGSTKVKESEAKLVLDNKN